MVRTDYGRKVRMGREVRQAANPDRVRPSHAPPMEGDRAVGHVPRTAARAPAQHARVRAPAQHARVRHGPARPQPGSAPAKVKQVASKGIEAVEEWRPEWRAHRREDRRKSEMAGDGWRRGLGGTRGRSRSREQALNRQAERTAVSSRRRHRQEPGKGWGEPRTVRRERRPVRFRDAKDARGNRERVQAELTDRGLLRALTARR